MPWLKRNLFLVLGGLIALGLLAFALYFLMGKSKADAAVTEELDGQIAAFKELVNRPVHPGTEKVNNIQAARQDLKRLHGFTADLRKHFVPSPLPEKLNSQAFRSYLDNTISE
ncbi:MAG: hypothetical protein HY674_14715, partial [Chloroflexi bacterium]|nr:hypothetical protein [Chloroflexota bacterium]